VHELVAREVTRFLTSPSLSLTHGDGSGSSARPERARRAMSD
jgi:hypothetical protein